MSANAFTKSSTSEISAIYLVLLRIMSATYATRSPVTLPQAVCHLSIR
jgi:hypothetical protein